MDTSERIATLLTSILKITSPALSGNMQRSIHTNKLKNGYRIIIDPKFYDMKIFSQTGKIKREPSREINGKAYKSYAYLVNEFGAFGKHNSSECWVNRACYQACESIASSINAELYNELRLK